jgi:Glycosyltransferase family 9 (heptosyltransferase)
MPGRSLLITNRIQLHAIGDAIAALPAAWILARSGTIGEVYFTSRAVVGLFDLGIPQAEWDYGSLPLRTNYTLETQEAVARSTGHFFRESLVQHYARAAGIAPDFLPWPRCMTVPPAMLPSLTPPPVLFAPYSNSDHGSGTKVWDMNNWVELANRVFEAGFPVYILRGAFESDDFLKTCPNFLVGRPLWEVAWWMQNAAAVVTVDNGMGWLAQALGAPHVHILSSNMPLAFSSDSGPRAVNISNCLTASVVQVWEALRPILASVYYQPNPQLQGA